MLLRRVPQNLFFLRNFLFALFISVDYRMETYSEHLKQEEEFFSAIVNIDDVCNYGIYVDNRYVSTE